MNPQLLQAIAQSRQEDLFRAAERARATRDRIERPRSSRRLRWTFRTPKTATAVSTQVRVA